jgi:hypothetical protein
MMWAMVVKRGTTVRESQENLRRAVDKFCDDMIVSSDAEIAAFFAQQPMPDGQFLLLFTPEGYILGKCDPPPPGGFLP